MSISYYIHWEKRLLLIMICQLTNVKEMIKLEKSSFDNHCRNTNDVKEIPMMLKLVGENFIGNEIFTWFQNASSSQSTHWKI